MYRTIDYKSRKIFNWFVDKVTENRCKGDEDPDKALLAEVFKLLGNSAYGKLIEVKERQTRVIYTKDQRVVDKAKRSVWFGDMEKIDDVFELEFRKKESDDQQAVSNRDCCLSAGQTANVAVLLRLPRLLYRQDGFRAHPDGHRQHVLGASM